MSKKYPITEPAPTEHAAWAAWWGEQALRAIRDAIANPHPTTRFDLDYDHAVRSTRLAAWHGFKAMRQRAEGGS